MAASPSCGAALDLLRGSLFGRGSHDRLQPDRPPRAPLRVLPSMIDQGVIVLVEGQSGRTCFRRRNGRARLESGGVDPIVSLAGKLAPLFGIFFLIILVEGLFLGGVLQIPFRGEVPLM